MNLGISKEGAYFISDAIVYFLSKTQYPDMLIAMYPGINVKEILTQLSYIQRLGESEADYVKARKKTQFKGVMTYQALDRRRAART